MKLEEKLRSELDSQHLMLERDLLVNILQWYDAGFMHLREGLRGKLAEYNQLIQSHVRARDEQKKEAVSVGDSPPSP